MATASIAARGAAVGATLLFILGACSSADEPRWSNAAAVESPATFESPRQTVMVEADPDIGNVAFRGVARGRTPHQVLAPADGRVLEVLFARDELVEQLDDVLIFVPDPSEAELIELEIARLEIERAVARSAPEAEITSAQTARDDLQATFDARAQTISAGATGVIGSTRQNITYSVTQGDVLFEISDPSDVAVELRVAVGDLESMIPGTQAVMTRTSDASDDIVVGSIAEVPDPGDLTASETVTVTVVPDDASVIELGQRFAVALPVEASADARWVSLEAVGRQAGSPFVLVVDDSDRLRRLDVVLGRRTLSHVQVLSGIEVGMKLVVAS